MPSNAATFRVQEGGKNLECSMEQLFPGLVWGVESPFETEGTVVDGGVVEMREEVPVPDGFGIEPIPRDPILSILGPLAKRLRKRVRSWYPLVEG